MSHKHKQPFRSYMQLLILRALLPLGAHARFLTADGFADEPLADLVGVSATGACKDSGGHFSKRRALQVIRGLHEKAERKVGKSASPNPQSKTLQSLAMRMGLSVAESNILQVASVLQTEPQFQKVCDWIGDVSNAKAVHVLAVLAGDTE